MAKKPPHVRVSIAQASCTILSSEAMQCRLCGAETTPNVTHHCRNEGDRAFTAAAMTVAKALQGGR